MSIIYKFALAFGIIGIIITIPTLILTYQTHNAEFPPIIILIPIIICTILIPGFDNTSNLFFGWTTISLFNFIIFFIIGIIIGIIYKKIKKHN